MKKKMLAFCFATGLFFGLGMAYADVDTPQFFIPVEAEVVVANVTVTQNADAFNFGQILPHLTKTAEITIDVNGVTPTANPAGAITAAENATATDPADNDAPIAGVLLDGTPRRAGGFMLTSDVDASVTITFPDTLTLTSDVIPAFGNAATMTVSDIRANSNNVGTGVAFPMTAGTAYRFHIGGVLTVAPTQGGGNYTHAQGLRVDLVLQ